MFTFPHYLINVPLSVSLFHYKTLWLCPLDEQVSPSPSVHIYSLPARYNWLTERESREGGRLQERIYEDKITENQRDDASTAGSAHSPGPHMDDRSDPKLIITVLKCYRGYKHYKSWSDHNVWQTKLDLMRKDTILKNMFSAYNQD